MGHAFKGFRNAEMYTILVLFSACWLYYMGFVVWIKPIYNLTALGFPYSIAFLLLLLNPFQYVVELSSMDYVLSLYGSQQYSVFFLTFTSAIQIILGALAFLLLIKMSDREMRLRMTPESQVR